MRRTAVPSGTWKWDALALFFLAGLVIFFYRQVLFGHSTFVFVDASRFFYPLWKWGAGVWDRGIIPLWNPDAQFGTPYLADPQTACAYPPLLLLYLFLTPTWAFSLLIVLHHLWAFLGFWFLARAQGYSRKASLIGTLVFGFSLHLICSSWTPVALMTISWIPWVFLTGEMVFQKKRGGLLWLSLAWAMQLAAGYPVLTYLTGLALGLHLMWKSYWPPRKAVRSSFGWLFPFGLAVQVATVYNLVWGLPFLELFRLSNYQQGANHFQDLHWQDLATAFAPFFQGHPLEANYHGPHYWVATYFIGLPALCLVAWGAFRFLYRKSSWGVFPVLLILSAGGLGTAEALRAILPGYALVIHSGYWISLLVLWAALLSTETLDFFLSRKSSEGVLSWALICLFIYGSSWALKVPSAPWIFAISLVLLIPTVFLKGSFLKWGLLLVSIGFSLGPAASSINILLDRAYYDQGPKALASLPQEGRLFFSPALMERSRVLEGPNMAQAYENAKQSLFPNWPLAFSREEAPFYNSLQLKSSAEWTLQRPYLFSEAQARDQLNYLNVRYLFGKSSLPGLRLVSGKDDPVEIYENPSPLPKWYSVQMAFGGSPDVEDFLRNKGGSIDYARECQVGDSAQAGRYQVRQVTYKADGPDRVEIDAEGRGKALIVSSETAYPGWKVRVEGREKPLELINCSFRGVALEDGENRAVFSYEPTSFKLGLFFCLLVLAFWAWAIFEIFWPRSRSSGRSQA